MLARPEIRSREHILMWLASKPPDEKFEWSNPNECPCGQYMYKDHHINDDSWAAYETLREMNMVASRHRSFGSLYRAMRQRWEDGNGEDQWEPGFGVEWMVK